MNRQAARNRDRQYKVILFLVIGLSVISSAVRDLNQLRLAVMDASNVVAELSDTFMSPPPALAIPPHTPAPSSCVAMTNYVRINSNGDLADDVEVPGAGEGVPPESSTVDEVAATKQHERTNKIKVQKPANSPAEVSLADVVAQAVSRIRNSTRARAHISSSTTEFSFVPGTAKWRGVMQFALAKGAGPVALPMTVNTEVDFRRLSDGVTYDFPVGKVTIRDRKVMKRSGVTGRQFLLKTSNGSFNVRAAS